MEYERILLVKPECHVYRLPPRASTNRAYRASDWGLDKPSWTGRMRITTNTKGKGVFIKLEDKTSGELFAEAPITEYPSVAVESVSDSSRYFVIKIADSSGRTAFIGVGFADRGDAFDFNVALQDHFNSEKKDSLIEAEQKNQPALDLKLKEGQTISINLGGKLKKTNAASKPKSNMGGLGGGLLPPPPAGARSIPGPPKSTPAPQTSSLLDIGASNTQNNDWSDFTSAQETTKQPTSNSGNWVQF